MGRQAQSNLEKLESDIEFIKDQITTTEVPSSSFTVPSRTLAVIQRLYSVAFGHVLIDEPLKHTANVAQVSIARVYNADVKKRRNLKLQAAEGKS